MEGYLEQHPSGSSGCHLSCKKARISPGDSYHGKDVRSIAREPSKNLIGNAVRDDRQQYQEMLSGSHSHVSQDDWQASVSNSKHLSNWNGCQTMVDDPNPRWNPSVCNLGGVQNSDLTTPVQLSQGAMETSNLTAMGSYQSSSSGNLRVEDNVNYVPSNHETLDNNHIQNVDVAGAIQPSSSIPEDNYIASTSVAPNLLFNIITLSPNWAFSGDHIKVCIIGRFLISPEEVQKYKWACAFGGVEVPAEVIIDGVLQCQTPSCGNGTVQFFVTCSNGLRCSEVREFDFLPFQVVDVEEDRGSAKTQQYIIRLQTLLYLESSNTSRTPIERWKAETFKLCSNVCAWLEDDSKREKLVNFTKLVKSSAHDVRDLCIQKKLRKQLRIWLLQKIAERGVGADTLDGEGQGVLHLVAALGYDWAIKPIVDARIVSIDLLDVNQDTALDWASRNGRNHTVKLLESYGATSRCAREPIPTYPSIVCLREPIPTNPDMRQIQQVAKSSWLLPIAICGVLGNHQQYTIETESPTRPPSGSLFLFDRSIQPRYRNDGHKWLKESHNEIKDFDLYCCYARGKENKHFYRRCYRMMKGSSSNIVLVHYLEVKASTSISKHGLNSTGDHNSDDNPDLGREHYHYPSSGPRAVNQTTKPNGANQMEQCNAGGLQNSYLIGPGRVQHTLKLLDATSTEYSSESSFDGNFNVEDSDNYSSSQQLVLDGLLGDDIVMIDSLDCCTSDQQEDVTEKTIQPCSWKGTDGSEDGDEKTPEDLSSSIGHQGISSYLAESITLRDSVRRNQGKAVATVSGQSATPLGYDDHEFEPSDDHARSLLLRDSERVHMAAVRIQSRFRSWKVRKELLLTRQQIIKIQDSSKSRIDVGKSVVTVPEQSASATPVGVGYNVWKLGVSDDHVLSLLPLRTNNAGQYSEPVYAAALRIQNKYRSWKGRKDFVLTRQQIIKIQAHARGYQVRVKKALDASEISMDECHEAPHGCHDSMNVPSEVRANEGGMADAAVEFLLGNLKQVLLYHGHLIRDAKPHVESLKRDLHLFKGFLKDSAKHRNKDATVIALVRQIRDLVYEIEDVIDSVVTQNAADSKRTRVSITRFLRAPSNLYSVAKTVEKIIEKVKSIMDKDRIEFATRPIPSASEPIEEHFKVPRVREDNIVGFDDEARTIITYLMQETEELDVISIIGLPGLGKTTLAGKIFRDAEIQYQFPTRIWVFVSEEFKTRDVFLAILSKFVNNTDDLKGKNDEEITTILRGHLAKGRFLIVLDDVWSAKAWTDLKDAFPKMHRMGKILITSQNEEVALEANQNRDPYKLSFLNSDDSFLLLQLEVFGKPSCPKELFKYAKHIVQKCGGLPLAIVVIGGILVKKSLSGGIMSWQNTWRKVSESVLTYLNEDPDLENIISLSYNKLPYYLRSCFLYLGMFPDDFEILVWRLIRLWIAEGFIQQKSGLTLEQTAEDYLGELVSRNLVMVARMSTDGRIKTCRVHDTLRQFCKKESGSQRENFLQEIKKSAEGGFELTTNLESYRRLCIHSNIVEFLSLPQLSGPRVRSFVCSSKEETFCLPLENASSIPTAFKLLRILDAKPMIFTKFPRDLANLVHLRYVVLSSNFSVIPETIAELWNLQSLIIYTTQRSLDIRSNIWKMVQLRHVKTNASAILPKREGSSQELGENIQTLGSISPQSCTEDVFDRLRSLRKLGIRGPLASLQDAKGLEKLENLEKLKLVNDLYTSPSSEGRLWRLPEHYRFPPKLRSLTLCATHLDWGNMSTLGMLDTLEVLKLKENAFMGDRWEVSTGHFHHLEVLHIERTNLAVWVAEANHFPRLKCLVLKNCEQLLEIPFTLSEVQSFRRLDLKRAPRAAASARRIEEARTEQLEQEPDMYKRIKFKLSIAPGDE